MINPYIYIDDGRKRKLVAQREEILEGGTEGYLLRQL